MLGSVESYMYTVYMYCTYTNTVYKHIVHFEFIYWTLILQAARLLKQLHQRIYQSLKASVCNSESLTQYDMYTQNQGVATATQSCP